MENREELAWLAGIVDGEGNFHLGSKVGQNGKEYLDVKVRVSSTDMRMIKRISEIYAGMNLRFHFARVNYNRAPWKNAISINTTSQGSTLKLLKTVEPFLVNKHDAATIMIEILDHVVSFPKGGNTSSYNYWESDRMKELMGRFKEEKAWYFDPSTTSRKANSIFEFDDKV